MAAVTGARPGAIDERYPSPRALLAKYGLRAKKSWGQNFLGDEGILDQIARLAVEAAGERVVELGAGLGHLTARLAALGADVVAVERDRDMAEVLRAELGGRAALLEADAARLDYARLAREWPGTFVRPERGAAESKGEGVAKLAVVGNLPYHLTSPILFSLLDQPHTVSRGVFLLQREVAERLAAEPGTKAWGLLSVLLQHRADVTVELRVPRGAFLPPPQVESAVLRVGFRAPRAPVVDEARFRRLVKAGFAQRRKVLANALAGVGEPERVQAALMAAGVDPRRRGETLTVEEWAAVERGMGGDEGSGG